MQATLKLSDASLGSSLRDSFGYSAQFVNSSEKQHREALSGLVDKQMELERAHLRTTEALRRQLEAVKQQDEHTAQTQLREANSLREELEVKMQGMDREREATERNLRQHLVRTQAMADETRAMNSRLKQQEIEDRLGHEADITTLHTRLRSLQQEKERLKADVIDTSHLEIEQGVRRQDELKHRHAEAISQMREGFSDAVQRLRNQIEEKQRLIKRTELGLKDLRQELMLCSESTERELQLMQSSLREVRQVLEAQEADLHRFKAQHDEAVKGGMASRQEAALLANEVNRLSRENTNLTEELKRLGRFVYGKGKSAVA